MTLSWKDVLDPKGWVGGLDLMYNRTLAAGYEYFAWNDRIYQITVGGSSQAIDTGLTVKDIE